jgi:hypothetical protein
MLMLEMPPQRPSRKHLPKDPDAMFDEELAVAVIRLGRDRADSDLFEMGIDLIEMKRFTDKQRVRAQILRRLDENQEKNGMAV